MANFEAMPRQKVKAHRKSPLTKVLRLIERTNFESERNFSHREIAMGINVLF